MTNEEAAMIVKNFKKYLENEKKINDSRIHEDVYTALDIAIEALAGKERIDGN